MAYRVMNMAKSTKMNVGTAQNKMMSLDKAKAGRIVLFRVLIILLADILVASLFDYINKNATRQYTFHMQLQTPMQIVFGAIFVLSLGYLAVTLIKKIDTSAQYMTPAMITALSLYVFVTTLFFDQFTNTPFLFYTMTVIVSVLFVVYYIYTILLYKK